MKNAVTKKLSGGVPPKCACCGEKNWEFLVGAHFHAWLKKNNYPEGFRALCDNCNMSLSRYGYCPHKNGNGRNAKMLTEMKIPKTPPHMNKDIIQKLFPDALRRMEQGHCPICAELVKPEDFEDGLSLKEFGISGMCQSCIDKTFK